MTPDSRSDRTPQSTETCLTVRRGTFGRPWAWVVPGILAAGLILALGAAIILRGGMDQFILAFFSLPIAAGLVAVGVLAFAVGRYWRRSAMRRLTKVLCLAAAAVALQAPGFLLGERLNDWDVKKAKGYCESLVPRLDAYRQRTGEYPRSLEQLPNRPSKLPRMLKQGDFYQSDGTTFRFEFHDPAGFIGVLHFFEARERTWQAID